MQKTPQKRFQTENLYYNAYQCWKRRLQKAHAKNKRLNEEILAYGDYLEEHRGITEEQIPFILAGKESNES